MENNLLSLKEQLNEITNKFIELDAEIIEIKKLDATIKNQLRLAKANHYKEEGRGYDWTIKAKDKIGYNKIRLIEINSEKQILSRIKKEITIKIHFTFERLFLENLKNHLKQTLPEIEYIQLIEKCTPNI